MFDYDLVDGLQEGFDPKTEWSRLTICLYEGAFVDLLSIHLHIALLPVVKRSSNDFFHLVDVIPSALCAHLALTD